MAKGGGSANKSYLFQETKAVLNPSAMLRFLEEKMRSLGTAACPPYHLAVVDRRHRRGARAEDREARLARATSTRCRPRASPSGHGFRDLELERRCSRSRAASASARSSAASTSATTCASSGCRATARRCPVAIAVSLLRGPAGAGQDHARGRVPRAARDRPGALPAGDTDEDLGGDVVRDRPATSRCPRSARADQASRSRRGCR